MRIEEKTRVVISHVPLRPDLLEHGTNPSHLVQNAITGVDDKTLGELAALQKQVEVRFSRLFSRSTSIHLLASQSAEMQLKALQQQQEFFVIQYQELCKIQAALGPQQKPDASAAAASAEAKRRLEGLKTRRAQLERILSEEGSKILRTRKMLSNFYQECLNSVSIVQTVFVRGALSRILPFFLPPFFSLPSVLLPSFSEARRRKTRQVEVRAVPGHDQRGGADAPA